MAIHHFRLPRDQTFEAVHTQKFCRVADCHCSYHHEDVEGHLFAQRVYNGSPAPRTPHGATNTQKCTQVFAFSTSLPLLALDFLAELRRLSKCAGHLFSLLPPSWISATRSTRVSSTSRKMSQAFSVCGMRKRLQVSSSSCIRIICQRPDWVKATCAGVRLPHHTPLGEYSLQ